MIITLKNGQCEMRISTLGAEPQSLIRNGIEYIWQGDREFWPRRAPLLFPMSGPTKDNKIIAKGKEYDMPNNGFARDNEFRGEQLTDTIAQFTLEDSEEFRTKYYPYGFMLTVTYTLHENGYTARAEIFAKEDLYYTFAWHPAFSLDVNGKGCDLETYSLSFEQNEKLDRLYQNKESYVREKDFLTGDTIELRRSETDKGPMVFRGVRSREVTLTSSQGEHGVTVDLGDMTTFVCWTQLAKHAQFVCLEPMASFGFADRPLEIEKMDEAFFLAEGESAVWENTFTVF